MFKMSVITSMNNRRKETLDVIENLLLPSLIQNGNANMELIIIDDFSPLENETREVVERYLCGLEFKFGNVVFTRNQANLGFAKSFNRGIKMARGEKLIIANDDLYFPSNSIEKLSQTLDEQEGCLIAGPITNANTSWSFQYCKQAPKLKAYTHKEIEKLELFAKRLAETMKGRRMATDNLCGFCFAADSTYLKDIGGFNEKYGYGFYEDTDLIQRTVRQYGIEKIVINLEVFVGHGGVKGASGTMLQEPLKMVQALVVNGFKYANDWGYGKLLKRVVYGLRSQLSGKGTISELLPREIRY
jgi:GT2 family glycosyltransferase